MSHFTSPEFWEQFARLPEEIQKLARENYIQLTQDPRHPSLRFKRLGSYWSVRVGRNYRALGTDVEDGILWGWIGSHAEYDKLMK